MRPLPGSRWGRRQASRVHAQAHPAPHPVRTQAVPASQLIHIHAELLGDRNDGVAAPHAVTHQLALGNLRACRGDDQFLAHLQRLALFEAVGVGNRRCRDLVVPRDGRERFPFLHAVASPAHPLVRGNCGDLREEFVGASLRKAQLEIAIAWGDHAQ